MTIVPTALKPINIGNIALTPPVVLAPMAGVTNMAFRELCRSYGAGLYVSEMMSARAIVDGGALRTARMLQFGDNETVRSVQLYGVEPESVGRATKILINEYGVHHVDMNFGCPAAKVTRKGGGAALPVHTNLFRSIVRAAVQAAGNTPVTVKMRIGVDAAHHTVFDAGKAAQDEGVAAVALHARTAEQLYSGHANWNIIGELKQRLTEVPVFGNGDIWEAHDAIRMMAETGCDGVVVGRGCLGKPWLFRDLVDAFEGRVVQAAPNLGGVIDVMKHHARLLCDFHGGDFGVRDFRKHVSWYLTGYPIGGERRKMLAMTSTLHELDERLDELDRSLDLPKASYRLARGHTNGPRPVDLPHRWFETANDVDTVIEDDGTVSGG